MKATSGKFLLAGAIGCALLIVLWAIILYDKTYFVAAGPVSIIGIVLWSLAGLLRWRWWSIALLPVFASPFFANAIW